MNYKRLFSRYFWKDLQYSIAAFFNPRQKWLRKHIPNTWIDKPELIKDVLFACLIHYVEEEQGLQDASFYEQDLKEGHISQEYYDHTTTVNNDLREVYVYLKEERKTLEDRETFENTEDMLAHWQLLDDKDMWAMTTIVKYSPYLWT